MKINYVTGDATRPIGDDNKIIVHICNDIGAWGAGFVLAISRRWNEPELQYRTVGQTGEYKLGTVRLIQVEADIWVANMIAQHGIGFKGTTPPIRYLALEKCLEAVAAHAKNLTASVHMPRIGCGLAGGKWDEVEKIVSRTLVDAGIQVTVYDLGH